MTHIGKKLCAIALCSLSAAALAETGTLEQALTDGKATLQFRYRLENVDQDAFAEDATASTLRARLNFETGSWQSWSGVVEFDHVAELLADDFNSGGGTSPGRTRYPVIADPKGTDLNQVYLQVIPDQNWRLRAGRQRILLDNQRFVGGVGWRQNEQTYDAMSVLYAGLPDTQVFYAFIGNTNRIFGNEVGAGDHKQETHLANAAMELSEAWKAVGYAYLVDNDDAPDFSTNTFGLRLTGALDLDGNPLSLSLEAATQSDGGNAPVDFNAGYVRLDGKLSLGKHWSASAGYEVLEGDADNPGSAFRTPLATLHAFNGWADQFLGTPAAGLEDLFLAAGFTAAPWTVDVVYHDYSPQDGGGDYGTEIDVAVGRSLGKRYGALAKLALFNADTAAFTDTTKFWLMLTANF